MGNVYLTRAWRPQEPHPGDTFTGVLERFGSQLLKASVTLKSEIDANQRPFRASTWFTYKMIPSVEKLEPEVRQLVMIQPTTLACRSIWAAEGTIEINEDFNDELHFLRPKDIVFAEYFPYLELSVGYGRVLATL